METAYDHIQEEVLKADEKEKPAQSTKETPESNLNTDLQDAYRSFSSSAWGVKLGGFLGSVRKQGESYYQSARDEASIASEEALKGFTDLKSTLVSRARGLSLGEGGPPTSPAEPTSPATTSDPVVPSADGAAESKESSEDPESEGFISRFRAEADKRLKEIQRAEDAADEALLKFGTNIRNFLKDAVSIAPPALDDEDDLYGEAKGESKKGKVLFESKDAEGRRVIHTTRADAQLHVIHCALDSFTKNPASPEWEKWRREFDVAQKTDAIAADLEKYEELRRAMERLVPEKVEYEAFWARYYFLRMVVASEGERRKEILKGAALDNEEEVGWDEESDEEPTTPQASEPSPFQGPSAATPKAGAGGGLTVKPSEPRTSQDQDSRASSDESYDLVSGAPSSRGPGSPREGKEKEKDRDKEKAKEGGVAGAQKREESDEEDWE